MNPIFEKERNELQTLLTNTLQNGINYLRSIEHVPTSSGVQEVVQRQLNTDPLGASAVLAEFKDRYQKIMVASTGPRYWGFVTGGATPAALMGDILATLFDQNTQAVKGNGDLSAILELETIKWLLELFELPDTFSGGFVTGATMSNFTCLAVGRQWAGRQLKTDIAKEGLSKIGTLPVLSATPHSSSVKALSMLGMGSNNLMTIKTADNRETMDIDDLEVSIQKLKGAPFILITSGGTVNSGDFDNFEAIRHLKTKYSFWWHIDAAFGAFARCVPEYRNLLKGWESADSITVDCHKWLNVPYESAVFFIRKEYKQFQVETFQNSNAPYLGEEEKFNYMNVLPENSRRLKALAAWFSLASYGKEGIASIVQNSIARARQFGKLIEENPQLESLAPIHLNIVSFTLRNFNDQQIDSFLFQLNRRGKVFMTPTVLKGRKGIRAAFVNWRTQEDDVVTAMNEINSVLTEF